MNRDHRIYKIINKTKSPQMSKVIEQKSNMVKGNYLKKIQDTNQWNNKETFPWIIEFQEIELKHRIELFRKKK